MNWKLRGLGQLLSHYSGPRYLLLRLIERLLLTSAGFGSGLESPWPGGLELCSWLTQTLPSKTGGGKNHDFMRDCMNTFLPGHLTFTVMFSYLRKQVTGTRCKWSKRHLRPSSPSWFLERLKGRRTRWPTKTQPFKQQCSSEKLWGKKPNLLDSAIKSLSKTNCCPTKLSSHA